MKKASRRRRNRNSLKQGSRLERGRVAKRSERRRRRNARKRRRRRKERRIWVDGRGS
jgi:hypothetical protein